MKAENNTLKNFMKEFFPFAEFRAIGVFTKEMKGDYEAQAKKICYIFGFETVFEYGAIECRCHLSIIGGSQLSIDSDGKLASEPFVTEIKSIYK